MDYHEMLVSNQRERKRRLAEIVLKKSFAYACNSNPPFTLTSGGTSNFYFNCKPTTLDPEGMNLIGEIVFEMLRDADVTAAGGLTLGADPIANALSLISYQKGKPIKSFTVRKEIKGHGTKSTIEGDVKPGEKVVILDDVITTGGSTITAIERVREAGLVVDRVIVLIDREEGGRGNIVEKGRINRACISAVLTRTEIMALFRGQGANPPIPKSLNPES